MTMQPSSPVRASRSRSPIAPMKALSAAIAAFAILCGAAWAAEPARGSGGTPTTFTSASVIEIGPNESAVARRLDISIGRSIIVDLPREAKEIFVANPKVANAVVRSTRKIFVIGIGDGATSLIALDSDGRQIATLEINVGRDLNPLRQTLRALFPASNVQVKPAGDSIILIGEVASAVEAQKAVDIAEAFVGSAGGATASGGGLSLTVGAGGGKGGVVNGLSIRGKDQVMLKVVVAEISRVALKQLGVNLAGNWAGFSGFTDNPFSASGQLLSNTALSVTSGPLAGSTLQAFERAGVSRTLAEPNLTAISGESAKFTAGGEIPFPSARTCDAVTNRCQIGIEYKPFGVTLNFTPVVLSENRISIRVGTEVTELDPENKVTLSDRVNGAINVLGTRVRRTETVVELPSGGSMVTAGLIQQTTRQAVNGLPALMNLPVLGALFRSRDYQRQETELMIMVTPYIVKPVAASDIPRPDEGYVDAHDGQTVLLGRLNKLYGVAGAPIGKARFRGSFGFIND